MKPKTKQIEKLLRWCLDHGQEDMRVQIGCKTCNERNDLLASTAYTAWLIPFHKEHDVWMKNPFNKGKS